MTWLVISTLTVVLSGALLVYLSAVFTNRPDELWLEAGKAGMQLLVLGVLGGLLTAGWQRGTEQRSAERAELAAQQQRDHEAAARERQTDLEEHERRLQRERELHDRQLATFLQVVSAYNGVKAVRRRLKSLGFGDSASLVEIDEWQASGFHEAMMQLSEHQLVFEAIARELRETRLFGEDSDSMVADLEAIESYLNKHVDFWEKHGADVRKGIAAGAAARGVHGVVRYSPFEHGVVTHRHRLTESMHRHLFERIDISGPGG
ncbi:hypothetical protein BKA24_002538 [Microbacterium marinum]|uniref:Uncharacterized protein n=1 Tax=Microbacterium marinum TaxID=421115 RepID=A0A7W7BS27_9MICO|nr:hypothetical protein [Microbacterium marinum]MBB4667829.1 hypothetical protein [Microbacterium marinum]